MESDYSMFGKAIVCKPLYSILLEGHIPVRPNRRLARTATTAVGLERRDGTDEGSWLPWNVERLLLAFQDLLFPDPSTVSSDYWNWLVWRVFSVNPLITEISTEELFTVEVFRDVLTDLWDTSVRISHRGSLCYVERV